MKRAAVLGTLVILLLLSTSIAALQQAPAPPAAGRGAQQPSVAGLTVDKIKENLFVIRGGGGNTAVFVMSNGVALVDTKIFGWGQPLIERIREISTKPVTTIINTHTHYDHVEGNPDFPATVEVVTHENTAKLMPEMRDVYGIQNAGRNVFRDANGRGLPKRTYKDQLTLFSGADRIDLHYFGRAHTEGDTFVVFPALRTMHTGDAFPNKGIPIMDMNNGGSALNYPETLRKAGALPSIDIVITGHNATTLTIADVKMYSEFNRAFVEAVRAAKSSGQTIDAFANSWKVPQQFLDAGYTQPAVARLRSNVEVAWKELN
jgi:glyoxylase-like metal-dependent hydrolase (beta-lactamase superfamily II)